jgi:hypothetical protein
VGVPVATMRQQFLSFSPFTSRVGSRTGFMHHVSSHMHVLAVLLSCLHFVNFFQDGKTGLAPPDLQHIDNQLIIK